ncbi:MAG: phosphoglycerate dehydrogenase [Thermodesulfobacteriaceae bacterium]|nr:phosphoglycerate dehydrogenase [Thermodesulfobacteriaceae bacterium]MCX8041824.1 phosphoglycerate dehydrogenase [Thermodesulfobacteriaceae bacterium]MDW8135295.1 phosphoglycerate dehydrogenase [Thermodesulfobacterium sp.]
MKVLISDSLSEEGIRILEDAGLEVIYKPGISKENLLEIISEVEALIIRSGTKVSREVIERAKNLKVIGRAGTGLDNVDLQSANEKGIVVMNVPGGNALSAAEHTIGLIFALARNIPQACYSLKSGKWERKEFMGVELNNKVLGIIGLGRIGSIVAERALALKMKIIAYDPYVSPESAERKGVYLVSMEELFRQADFITIHTPLTKETYHLIDEKAFSKMKDGVYIINCARGGIVDEMALYKAMVSGKVAGAALDVFEQEPPPSDHPLFSLKNFIGTPHLGASTVEAQQIVACEIAKQVVDYLLKGEIRNAVNVPSISAETLKVLGPVLTLAEKVGLLISQIAEGAVQQVEVTYKGELAKLDTKPVTISLVRGLLYKFLKEDINYVNALFRAKERDIKIVEATTEISEDFTSLISVKVKHTKGEDLVEGTLFGKKEPRIVRINDFRLDALPEGHMLYIFNEDKPGVIGKIGTTLGNHNLNISRMHVGQDPKRKMNIILLSLDTPPTEESLKDLRAIPTVYLVKPLEL